jgi:hypothetical protein
MLSKTLKFTKQAQETMATLLKGHFYEKVCEILLYTMVRQHIYIFLHRP